MSTAVEQTLYIAQQDDEVRVDERRDHGGELIVVSEAKLVCRDRIVFVQNGNRGNFEKRSESGAGVVLPRSVREVRVRQQDLATIRPLAANASS